GQLFIKAATAQTQLFQPGLASRQTRLEFGLLTGFVLLPTTLLFAFIFLLALCIAKLVEAAVQLLKLRLTLFALSLQALQFLPACQQPGLGLRRTSHPQEMPTDPIAVTADQAFAFF